MNSINICWNDWELIPPKLFSPLRKELIWFHLILCLGTPSKSRSSPLQYVSMKEWKSLSKFFWKGRWKLIRCFLSSRSGLSLRTTSTNLLKSSFSSTLRVRRSWLVSWLTANILSNSMTFDSISEICWSAVDCTELISVGCWSLRFGGFSLVLMITSNSLKVV